MIENGQSMGGQNRFRKQRKKNFVCTRKLPARRGPIMRVLSNLENVRVCRLLSFFSVSDVALRELLVFNVASQKNAISHGFCPFITGAQCVAGSFKALLARSVLRNKTAGLHDAPVC